jgi:8-oxo-dGTP pyrophosphatase MutT (NUDIX family)
VDALAGARAVVVGSGAMLDLDETREGVPPRDAATLVLVRDAEAGGVEVFCVERNKKSRFLGGAVVFPGGKLDDADADPLWASLVDATDVGTARMGATVDGYRALRVAACRESLEEAAILPTKPGGLAHDALLALRRELERGEGFAALVARLGQKLDLGALHPFARWVTPTAEARRFDARFFLARAPSGQPGVHDEHETTASFWASPRDVLARFGRGELQLAPPTHRTLEILERAADAEAALSLAAAACLEPICPRLVRQRGGAPGEEETLALVLPGDPEHGIAEPRVPGHSRYVLRGDRWLPEPPP